MAASTAVTTVLPPVKNVMVYRNGDPFYCGRRFVINQRQVSTMDAFLNEVTQCIGAPLAIRNLYTPRQGHKVIELQDLQTGGQYVAAGFEKFKKLDYLNAGIRKPAVAREESQARIIQRPNVSAKWRKYVPVPCIIHVFRNGDLLCAPFRFILPRSMKQDLEQILSLVTEKVSLRTGAVRRLCSLEGVTVGSAAELETGHCYVAVGTEKFKKLPYMELLVSKAAERYYPGKKRMLRGMENRKAGSGPEDRYSDSALLDSPESDGRRVKSTGDDVIGAPQGARREESSVFDSRPVKMRKNRARPLISSKYAPPSVFKRPTRKRREEVRGAEEIQEDENTATELPVDQRVAEIVEDEEPSNTGEAGVYGTNQEPSASDQARTESQTEPQNMTVTTQNTAEIEQDSVPDADKPEQKTSPNSRAPSQMSNTPQDGRGVLSDNELSAGQKDHSPISVQQSQPQEGRGAGEH